MNKHTDTKLPVRILGRFMSQLRSRVYQCIYLSSAVYIAHRESQALSGVVEMNGLMLFASLVLVYLLMILVSVFLFNTVLVILESRSEPFSGAAASSENTAAWVEQVPVGACIPAQSSNGYSAAPSR